MPASGKKAGEPRFHSSPAPPALYVLFGSVAGAGRALPGGGAGDNLDARAGAQAVVHRGLIFHRSQETPLSVEILERFRLLMIDLKAVLAFLFR